MPKATVFNVKGEKIKDIKLKNAIFDKINDTVLYDAIVLANASLRQGSRKTKDRSEVRGGGKKPWRQKGTGRARHGSNRSPIWVGGGVTFGISPEENFSKKQNKKERKLAIRTALSYKVKNNELKVLDVLSIENNKTKDFKSVLSNLKLDNSSLFITTDLADNVLLSSRNLKKVKILLPSEMNVLDVVNYKNLIITEEALKTIEEVLI